MAPRAFFAALLALLFLTPGAAFSARRVALVVGNDAYAHLEADEQLRKAVNDARTMTETLSAIGFEVTKLENAGRGEMLAALFTATERLAAGDTAFVFFAGHGVAIDGANYLLPSDVPRAGAGQEGLIRASAVPESLILSRLREKGVTVGIVVIDACRNNPFNRDGTRSLGDAARGLTRLTEAPEGLYGIYSAGDGQTALDRLGEDDDNPNSVFTRVLAPALREPGRSLDEIAFVVRDKVQAMAKSVGHQQRPAIYDEVNGGRIYLAGAPTTPPPPRSDEAPSAAPTTALAPAPAAAPCADAKEHYGLAAEIGSAEAFQAHLETFGACPYAAFARSKLAALVPSRPAEAATTPSGVSAPATPTTAEPQPSDPVPDVATAPSPTNPAPDAAPPPTADMALQTRSAVVGKWPEGLALAGGRLFVALSGERQLAEVDPETLETLDKARVGRLPVGVAALADGAVLTVVQTDKVIWRREPSGKGRVIARFKGCPVDLAAAIQTAFVVVWPDCSNVAVEIHVIDGKTGQTLRQILAPPAIITRMVPAGDALFAAYDLQDRSVVARINNGPGDGEEAEFPGVRLQAIASDGESVFVAGRDAAGTSGVVAPAGDPSGVLSLPEPIAALAATPGRVVAIGEKGTLFLLSDALRVERTIAPETPFGARSAFIDGDRLFVTSFEEDGERGMVRVFEGWR